MYDVIILGKGPAGISASLYTSRAKLNTLIIGRDSYLIKSNKIDNYYGFPEGITGKELLTRGEIQAKQFGADIINDTVLSIEFGNGTFEVVALGGKYTAKAVLISTGQTIDKVNIENIEKFEGKGIHYCVTCDGFFYNGLNVGILGYTDYAVHEAVELLNFSKNITIYTDGKELEINDSSRQKLIQINIPINQKKVVKLEGEENLEKIVFDDSEENIDGIFVAYGSAGSIDFARKLGMVINKGSIVVDKDQKTNIPGIFSAGDCTGVFKQIAVAVGQGAIAGQKIIEYVRNIGK